MTPLTSSSPAAASLSRPTEALQAKAAARRAECCDHDAKAESRRDDAERSEGPRRSPLLKALVQALREVLAAPTATTGAAEAAPTKAAAPAGSADTVKTDAAATDATAEADKAPAAAGGDALEQALTAFARALMQALRGGDDDHRGRGHHHGHHFGRREGAGWGDDPAQRLDRLASMVAQAALGTAPAKPQTAAPATTAAPTSAAGATSTAAPKPATASTASTATDVAPVTAPAPAAATAPATLVLEIRLVPGVSSASPWARAANDLVGAFGSLQQALGRSTAADNEGSVREQLATFLRNLAARVRGDEAAMSDVEPTRPGALLSVTA